MSGRNKADAGVLVIADPRVRVAHVSSDAGSRVHLFRCNIPPGSSQALKRVQRAVEVVIQDMDGGLQLEWRKGSMSFGVRVTNPRYSFEERLGAILTSFAQAGKESVAESKKPRKQRRA